MLGGRVESINVPSNGLILARKLGKNLELLTSHVFKSKVITLKNQGSEKCPVKVDTKQCMEYLTELVDLKTMLEDLLVSGEKILWMKTAFACQEVDVFDVSTWDGIDYELLVDLVHQIIVPHAVHQQPRAKYVQSIDFVSSTNVNKDRQSNRVNGILYVMRDFSVQVKAQIKECTGKDVWHVERNSRAHLFSEHCNVFSESFEKAIAVLGEGKYKELVRLSKEIQTG